ncbi:MAG TPA: electron transfer flavoprotein subunit beta/FixA family protein [Candidatus Polarisedimenticolia bacterium]|nr:electron transfer flavoprotein subunit beta/FixA family protein [Candidatus Polarisedimenticolia bacterium]
MKIGVCIKQVPDTETKVKVAADGRSLDAAGVTFVISPYDEYALEEALRIKEKQTGEVVVFSVGDERTGTSLRTALAMGADRAVHLKDAAFEGSDAVGLSRILAAALKPEAFDLILMGKQAVGTDRGQIGPRVAELLGLPHVSVVTHLEVGEGSFRAHREIEGAHEIVEGATPALVTAQKGLNEPRYASLKGILAAKKKEMKVLGAADLGIDPATVGHAGARTRWEKLELPPARTAGKMLKDMEPAAAAHELVRLLREEAKVI